jgi:hypothetical protein
VPGDFAGDVAIDFDDLKGSLFRGELVYVLVGECAIGVPVGPEVDQSMGKPVGSQVVVQLFQVFE